MSKSSKSITRWRIRGHFCAGNGFNLDITWSLVVGETSTAGVRMSSWAGGLVVTTLQPIPDDHHQLQSDTGAVHLAPHLWCKATAPRGRTWHGGTLSPAPFSRRLELTGQHIEVPKCLKSTYQAHLLKRLLLQEIINHTSQIVSPAENMAVHIHLPWTRKTNNFLLSPSDAFDVCDHHFRPNRRRPNRRRPNLHGS